VAIRALISFRDDAYKAIDSYRHKLSIQQLGRGLADIPGADLGDRAGRALEWIEETGKNKDLERSEPFLNPSCA
jgi:hypothetical protein